MKRLICEMCGSTDLVKQDGVFVCQTCGCKYSVEEAKKMMIEGKVDVSGSIVKVDNTEKYDNYLKSARLAKKNEDWGETERNYNFVKENDPDNLEAIFYSTYAKIRQNFNTNKQYEREDLINVLINNLKLISERYNISDEALNSLLINICIDINELDETDFLYIKGDGSDITVKSLNKLRDSFIFDFLYTIVDKHSDNLNKFILKLLENSLEYEFIEDILINDSYLYFKIPNTVFKFADEICYDEHYKEEILKKLIEYSNHEDARKKSNEKKY